MPDINYSENLFRSIDTIVAERIKHLPYDYTQLMEITDDTNASSGMYKVTADSQFEEIAYADNPTYQTGDKVYVLHTPENERRLILGLFLKNTTGRTDRVLPTLKKSLNLLDEKLDGEIIRAMDEEKDLNAYLSFTAEGLISYVEDIENELSTRILQTASEIRLEAVDRANQLEASLSITAGQIRSEVHDYANQLESSITQTAGQIRSEVHDYQNQLESSITQTAGQIRAEVHDYQNQMESSITQTASQIRSEVNDLGNNLSSSITQTATEIRSEVRDGQRQMESSITQTAEEIRSQVKDANKGMSLIKQTADSISHRVEDLEGNYSEIRQTADEISSAVYGKDGAFSQIRQTKDEISSAVYGPDGAFSQIQQTKDMIMTKIADTEGNLHTEVQTATESLETFKSSTTTALTTIQRNINGIAIFDPNNPGEVTEIGKGFINTLKITADNIEADNFQLSDGSGYLGFGEGATTDGSSTYGPKLSSNGGNYVITTNAGVRMQGGNNTSFFVMPGSIVGSTRGDADKDGNYSNLQIGSVAFHTNVYTIDAITKIGLYASTVESSVSITTSSDQNLKHDISFNIEKYEPFFDLLKPASFKYNNGTSDRIHLGFIAQPVKEALISSNLTTQDFAGYVSSFDYNDKGDIIGSHLGLRYEEFISLNTHMIQKTRKELKEKDKEIQELKSKVIDLEEKINLLLNIYS